jgi:hypothetical protein
VVKLSATIDGLGRGAYAFGMTRLEEAAQRLERAVARLDAATAKLGEKPIGDRQLALQLAAAKADYAKLQEVTRAVATRLDGAIERLDAVIEG